MIIGDGIHVYQYSLDGNYIREWISIRSIKNELGFADTNIAACCRGIQKYAYGYIWSFERYDKVKPVIITQYHQYDLEGNYIDSYNTIQEINKSLGFKSLPILEACSGSRRQAGGYQWSYEKKDKIEPVKEKQMKNNANSKKVYQYTLDGDFVCEWVSASEVGRQLNCSNILIVDCCNGKRRLALGYQWSYVKVDKMKKVIPAVRKINQYTLNKEFVKTWNNAAEIKEVLGIDNKGVLRCCKRKISTYKDFIWIYESEDIADIVLFE